MVVPVRWSYNADPYTPVWKVGLATIGQFTMPHNMTMHLESGMANHTTAGNWNTVMYTKRFLHGVNKYNKEGQESFRRPMQWRWQTTRTHVAMGTKGTAVVLHDLIAAMKGDWIRGCRVIRSNQYFTDDKKIVWLWVWDYGLLWWRKTCR